jgi:hypothetical protein
MRKERQAALDTLRVLGTCLAVLSAKTGGLKIESKRVRLLELRVWWEPPTPTELDSVLAVLGQVADFVSNWTDYARPQDTRDEARTKRLHYAMETIKSELWDVAEEHREPVLLALKIQLDGASERESDAQDTLYRTVIDPTRLAVQAAIDAVCALADTIIKDTV